MPTRVSLVPPFLQRLLLIALFTVACHPSQRQSAPHSGSRSEGNSAPGPVLSEGTAPMLELKWVTRDHWCDLQLWEELGGAWAAVPKLSHSSPEPRPLPETHFYPMMLPGFERMPWRLPPESGPASPRTSSDTGQQSRSAARRPRARVLLLRLPT